MAEVVIFCRVCLEKKRNNFSLYLHVQEKYLPSLIENICGVLICSLDEPEARICKECALAIIEADEIILKCQESNKILAEQQNALKAVADELEKELQQKNESNFDWNPQYQRMKQKTDNVQSVEGYDADDTTSDFDIQIPEATLGLNLTNTFIEVKQEPPELLDLDSMNESLYFEPQMIVEPILGKPVTTHNNTSEALLTNSTTALRPNMYCSTSKATKPKKKYMRSREQYLKRKKRNLPVKEPLTLIGGAGVVRQRKPKTFHRAIPNFYFKCDLCHEFESNVAAYSITHLNKVHQIDRPAIFKCQFCDTKPFIKNQSLQEHISTIHQQQPKPRDYQCVECGKSYIKNCHLQKHLMSVHKRGLLTYQCEQTKYENSHTDRFALKVHMKQMQIADQPYFCELCGKRFVLINRLRAHVKAMHSINSSYTCAFCGHKFPNATRFETHMLRARCKNPL